MNSRPAITGGTPIMGDQEAGIVRPSIASYTTPELLAKIEEVLRSNQVTNGINVRRLEEEMAEFLGVDHVAAVSSCTLGQTLALQAAGIVGKEVIIPSFTIAATANAAYWNRNQVVLADLDRETLNISLEHVEQLINENTGAIMPVHVFGNPNYIDELATIGRRHGVPVVYDSAQAFGAFYKGVRVGRYGMFEVFSGSPTKHFTSAEGGFVATNDAELANMIRLTRNYGVLPNYDCIMPGLNARMPEINAVIGRAIMKGTEGFVSRRNTYAAAYQSLLSDLPGLSFQKVNPDGVSSYNYFAMMIEAGEFGLTNREMEVALKAEHIGTKVYYHPPIHQQKVYRTEPPLVLPNTEWLTDRIICLPMYNDMDDLLLERITSAIRRIRDHRDAVRSAISGRAAVA